MKLQSITFGYNSFLKQYAHYCAYCGGEMLPDNEFDDFISSLRNQKGSEFKDRLIELSQISEPLDFYRKEILSELIAVAKNKPEKTFGEISKSLINSHEKEFNEFDLDGFIEDDVLELPFISPKVSKYIDNYENLDPLTLLLKIHSKLENNVTPEYKEATIKLEKAIINTFIIQNEGNLPYKLFEPLKNSIEHIKAHSNSGEDTIANYIYIHPPCNKNRYAKDFDKHIIDAGISEDNIKKSLVDIKNSAAKDGYKNIQEELDGVCNTLNKESNGILNISV